MQAHKTPSKVPATAARRKNSTNMSHVSLDDSSEVEEEKLPPFVGSVESNLHKEYN